MKKHRFVPWEICHDIYRIDYEHLFREGVRIILFDLDNTILPCRNELPDANVKALMTSLRQMGFIPVIMSNNNKQRIDVCAEYLETIYFHGCRKPFKSAYKKVLQLYPSYDRKAFIAVGDQIITDVRGAARMNIRCILVPPLDRKGEKWYTRCNRIYEKIVINGMKKYDREKYLRIKTICGKSESGNDL